VLLMSTVGVLVWLGTDVYNEVLAIYERNYPETLSRTYVVNGTLIDTTACCAVNCQNVAVCFLQQCCTVK